MAKILTNYIYNKMKDEYKLMDSSMVFKDMPIAVLDTDEVITEPLVVLMNNEMTVVDRKKYELKHKKFVLTANEFGKVVEDPNGMLEAWLPKDTDVSQLRLINNILVKVGDTSQEEAPSKKKETPKKKTTKSNEKTTNRTVEKEN